MATGRLITVCTVVLMGFASAAMAASIDQRVGVAQARIERGIRSGDLNRQEAHRLREELNRVRDDEARARADGRLDRRERERLNRELVRLERHISQLKHNDVQRRRP